MQIDRVVNAIAEGTDSPGLRAKLVKLEGELAELSFRREDEAAIVNLAPDLPAFYRKQVEALTELVKAPELLPRAVAILRDLLDRLVLRPTEARGSSNWTSGPSCWIATLCRRQASRPFRPCS